MENLTSLYLFTLLLGEHPDRKIKVGFLIFISLCMESRDSTSGGYGSQQRILMVIHYGLSGDLWIGNQHTAESSTRGNNGALTVPSLWLSLTSVIFQMSLKINQKRWGGKPQNHLLFFPLESLENFFIKTLQILLYYECEENAIILRDSYLTFSKDSSLVVKNLYILNFWKFICNLNLFGLSYQVDRLI